MLRRTSVTHTRMAPQLTITIWYGYSPKTRHHSRGILAGPMHLIHFSVLPQLVSATRRLPRHNILGSQLIRIIFQLATLLQQAGHLEAHAPRPAWMLQALTGGSRS